MKKWYFFAVLLAGVLFGVACMQASESTLVDLAQKIRFELKPLLTAEDMPQVSSLLKLIQAAQELARKPRAAEPVKSVGQALGSVANACKRLGSRRREFNFSKSGLEHIPPFLKHATGLFSLDLHENELSARVLQKLNLPALAGLEELYLDENDLGDFADLSNLKNLKVLYLSHCRLTDKALEQVAKLTSLEKLVLNSNLKLTNFASLAALKNLKKLYVGSCNITDQALEAFAQITSLEVLVLNYSGYNRETHPTKLTPLQALENLKELGLRGTQCNETILATLGSNFPHLTKLDIGQNYFTRIPGNVAQLPKLKNLSLTSNSSSGQPLKHSNYGDVGTELLNDLCKLSHVQILNISSNGITSLPDEFKNLPLEDLTIIYGQLNDAAVAIIASIKTLREMMLTDMQLSENALKSIGSMTGLKKLVLHDIGYIKSSKNIAPLAGLASLEELDLSRNGEGEIPYDWLSTFKALKKLKKLTLWWYKNGTSFAQSNAKGLPGVEWQV